MCPIPDAGGDADRVFTVGSINSVAVQMLDLAANTWTQLADSPLNIKIQYNNRIVRWEDT